MISFEKRKSQLKESSIKRISSSIVLSSMGKQQNSGEGELRMKKEKKMQVKASDYLKNEIFSFMPSDYADIMSKDKGKSPEKIPKRSESQFGQNWHCIPPGYSGDPSQPAPAASYPVPVAPYAYGGYYPSQHRHSNPMTPPIPFQQPSESPFYEQSGFYEGNQADGFQEFNQEGSFYSRPSSAFGAMNPNFHSFPQGIGAMGHLNPQYGFGGYPQVPVLFQSFSYQNYAAPFHQPIPNNNCSRCCNCVNGPQVLCNGLPSEENNASKKKPMILEESKERFTGRLKFYDETKNFGFIIMDKDGSDIFAHFDDFLKANIPKEVLRASREGIIIQMSFACLTYIGKHNHSRKAVNIKLIPQTPEPSLEKNDTQLKDVHK